MAAMRAGAHRADALKHDPVWLDNKPERDKDFHLDAIAP